MVLGSTNVFANRQVDLSPKIIDPAVGTKIINGDSVHLKVMLKNNGPDDLEIGDTIVFHFLNPNPNAVLLLPLKSPLHKGDSIILVDFTTPLTYFGNDPLPTNADLCFIIYDGNSIGLEVNGIPVTISYDEINTSNNLSCVSLTISDSTTSITGLPDVRKSLILYPNPARSQVNLKINLKRAVKVDAVLRDISGRVIKRHTYGIVQSGNNSPLKLDVSDIAPGFYIFILKAGNQIFTRKVTIQN